MGDCDETRGSVNAAATERTIIDQQGTRGRCASGVVLWCVRADIQAGLREGREGGRRASKEGNLAGAVRSAGRRNGAVECGWDHR
jgi:hypothetical protein